VSSRGRITRALVAGLLAVPAVLCLPVSAPVLADPRSEQERADREVAEAEATLEHATERAQRAAARYAAADAALPAAEVRVNEARTEMITAQVHADTAVREAGQAQAALVAATDRFDTSAAEVESARDQVTGFAVAAYKGGGIVAFNLLLQARGPTEVAERLGFLGHVSSTKHDAFEELAVARLHARQAENAATVAQERAEATRQATAVALAEAESAEAAAEFAAADAAALAETRSEALAAAEAEREESLSRYEQAEAEAARIAAEVREWEARQRAAPDAPEAPAPGSSGAPLLMPTHGWMSSPYGMRYDPFFAVWQLHAGVDIAASGGSPIYAAAEGTVIRAGWFGGYGNFTCLGHGSHRGGGLSTCYAHQSQILVSPGDWVGRGDLIGRVGTTGASTGNHLHFEVRLDGSPTDPVPFLPGF
jgi:murein DD-endopeptidase MepM/ murein hydrolase activator NlpD